MARQLRESDFHDFDLILAMDADNLARLQALRPPGSRAVAVAMGDLVQVGRSMEIEDPYDFGADAFARVFAQLEQAVLRVAQNSIPQQ